MEGSKRETLVSVGDGGQGGGVDGETLVSVGRGG